MRVIRRGGKTTWGCLGLLDCLYLLRPLYKSREG